MVSLGYTDSVTRNSEAMNLLDYGFNQYEAITLYKKGDTIGSTKLNKASISSVELETEEDVLIIKKKVEEDKEYNYEIKIDNLSYPINKYDKIGVLKVKYNNEIVKEVNLLSKEGITKISFIKLYFNILRETLIGS